MATVVPGLMTTEQFLALPDDGVERWLVEGELWEKRIPEAERGVTVRNRVHSRIMACVVTELELWRRGQPVPSGQVLCGEAGIRLSESPDTSVGADVVFVSSDVIVSQSDATSLVLGVPTLAVEIVSPYDTVADLHKKLSVYRKAGVPQVWVIDPFDRAITVHRPNSGPALFNDRQEIDGAPELPGFRVAVARLFD
jgi:Uma2 family endonuclease